MHFLNRIVPLHAVPHKSLKRAKEQELLKTGAAWQLGSAKTIEEP
jgi:hypothetical protein